MNGTPGSTNSTGSPSPIVVSHNEGNGSSNANNLSPRNYNTHLHPHHLHISKSDSELMDSTNDGSSPKEHSERLPILVHHHSLRSKGEKDFNNIFGENEQAMKEMEQFSQMQSSPRLMSARISTGMSGISSPRNGEAVTNSGSSLVTSTSSPASKKALLR
ncbi:hypothetical protein C9374_004058 [Naegleria lovaniensis]|uniref:Uncharacterized protein n=1 Tax=Naegleria lovaniensis TaxID=51637 RepID=A0AA88GT96_NAELO|nr:uncharacterized protein C9374_004058 [Naegleria lovaniensis]KAG2385414.1 hypothetical protein C9374_004058 [Naegleria lovaniensis]